MEDFLVSWFYISFLPAIYLFNEKLKTNYDDKFKDSYKEIRDCFK